MISFDLGCPGGHTSGVTAGWCTRIGTLVFADFDVARGHGKGQQGAASISGNMRRIQGWGLKQDGKDFQSFVMLGS